MNFKKIICACIAILLSAGTFKVTAQANTVTAGGDATGAGGKAAYTIGETFYTHTSGESGSISLGVQQPNVKIMVSTDETGSGYSIHMFPNPSSGSINLEIDQDAALLSAQLTYALHDVNGNLIEEKKIKSNMTNLTLAHLPEGMYICRIHDNHTEIRSFKIFKSR